MDDYGNCLSIFWGNDLRLLLANDQARGAYGFSVHIGRQCFADSMGVV